MARIPKKTELRNFLDLPQCYPGCTRPPRLYTMKEIIAAMRTKEEKDPLSKFSSENEDVYQILEIVTEDDLIEINKRTYETAIEDGIEAHGFGAWSRHYLKFLVSDIREMANKRKHFIEISAMIMQEIVRKGDAPNLSKT